MAVAFDRSAQIGHDCTGAPQGELGRTTGQWCAPTHRRARDCSLAARRCLCYSSTNLVSSSSNSCERQPSYRTRRPGSNSKRRPSSAVHRPNSHLPGLRTIVYVLRRRPRVLRSEGIQRAEALPIMPSGAQDGARRQGRIRLASAALPGRLR